MFDQKPQTTLSVQDLRLKKLTSQQVEQIDELLESLEEHGELRLIVQRGVLKYINRVEKHPAWETDVQE